MVVRKRHKTLAEFACPLENERYDVRNLCRSGDDGSEETRLDDNYEGIFVARGIPEYIQALKQDSVLRAELEPGVGKEASMGEYSVLVFRRQYWGRPRLDALARHVAAMHRGIEIAVAMWRPDGMGFGIGFQRGVEWHRLDSNNPGTGLAISERGWSSIRKTTFARITTRHAEWFTNLLSSGKLVWVMTAA